MTLKELAREIGCSRATLDRVINNRDGVGEERRKEILRQIEAIGYKPNRIGKVLARQKRTSIGVILCADITPVENPLFHIIEEGMLEAAEDLKQTGVRFLFRYLKSGTAEEQIQVIDELINECGVSGIALSLEENAKNLFETIQGYMERGIHFVSYFNVNGTENPKFHFSLSLGTNQQREGYVAAGLMGRFLQGRGKVALLSGLEKNLVHQLRVDYAKEYLEREYPNIEILPVIRNCFPQEVVEAVVDELVVDYPDLSGIIVSCGFSHVLTERLISNRCRERLSIIVYDFTNKTIEDLTKGYSDAVIGVDLRRLGVQTVNAVYDCVFQNEIRREGLEIPLQISLKESVMEL